MLPAAKEVTKYAPFAMKKELNKMKAEDRVVPGCLGSIATSIWQKNQNMQCFPQKEKIKT